jgi:hypothetical protein
MSIRFTVPQAFRLGCAHPSIRGPGKWTPNQYAALVGSPSCRSFAQSSPGLWITLFLLADGKVVGRIMKDAAAPVGTPWLWTLALGQHEDRTPTHGYEPTREAAMAAFAKSWRRQ